VLRSEVGRTELSPDLFVSAYDRYTSIGLLRRGMR